MQVPFENFAKLPTDWTLRFKTKSWAYHRFWALAVFGTLRDLPAELVPAEMDLTDVFSDFDECTFDVLRAVVYGDERWRSLPVDVRQLWRVLDYLDATETLTVETRNEMARIARNRLSIRSCVTFASAHGFPELLENCATDVYFQLIGRISFLCFC
jgi:hypothetical protein